MTKKLLIISALLLTLAGQSFGADQLLDRIVAVVGQNVITRSELIDQARDLYAKLQHEHAQPMPSRDQIIQTSLDQLITQTLELQEAKRLGIGADPGTIAAAIASIARNNQMTVPQLRQTLQSQGMSFSQFQDKIRRELIARRLIDRQVASRIQISKSEVDQEMAKLATQARKQRQVDLLHILIPVAANARKAKVEAAMHQAEQVRKRIDQGGSFKAIARSVSAGPHAKEGGDTGWLTISQLPKEFAGLINSMHAGQVEGPFRGNEGYHIIKVAAFRNEAEKRDLVPQTHVRHILIRTNQVTSNSDAQERLEHLRTRALQGDDFATLARANSEDQGSAINGGDLGWISPGRMPPTFESVMNKTPVNGISEPFKTRAGWEMLQVLGRRMHDESVQARRDAAKLAILQRKLKQAKLAYLQQLRGETYIKIFANKAQ